MTRARALSLRAAVGALAPALVALLGASSCAAIERRLDFIEVAEAKAHNLEQLHNEDGSYRYRALLLGDLQYLLQGGVGKLVPGVTLGRSTKPGGATYEPKAVRDPAGETLYYLDALAKIRSRKPQTRALQVGWYARLAVEDRSVLVRERAVLELGRVGRRLEVGPPVGLPPEAVPLGATEVGERIARLVRAFRGELAPEQAPGAAPEGAGPVLDELDAATLDVDGARRALRGLGVLLGRPEARGALRERMVHSSDRLQAVLVAQVVARALGDPAPRVRAAAVRAAADAGGAQVLGPMLLQLPREPAPQVVLAVLGLVAERGLPQPDGEVSAERYAAAREAWTTVLLRHAIDHPDGAVRIAAMRALREALEVDLPSLREEDWEAWRLARDAGVAGEPGS